LGGESEQNVKFPKRLRHRGKGKVLAAVLPFNPREVFCEVLNPKGDNVQMMVEALAGKYPHHAAKLENYSPQYWAKFTWKVLTHGVDQSTAFVPWPDTRRIWRPHLTEEHANFLESDGASHRVDSTRRGHASPFQSGNHRSSGGSSNRPAGFRRS
jgi:hypothetical protein